MLLICAALLAGAVCTTAPAQEVSDLKGGPMGVERIAKLANYSVYSSVPADSLTDTCWMQVDLGRSYPIDQVKLYPVIWDWWLAVWRPRFPVRFKLEAADNEAFVTPRLISDQTAKDYEVTIVDKVDSYAPSEPVSGRYVRLTVTKLPEFIYSIADDGIYVNLFNEYTIEGTQSDGNEMSVRMQTAFPENPEVKLTVSPGNGKAYSNIRLRVPQWADAPMEVTVNGKRVGTGRPGSYLALKRTWKKGDVIAFTLPIGFRLTKYNGTAEGFKGTEAYALEYGPLLMAAMSPSEEKGFLDIPVSPSELPSKLKPENNDPLRFKVECSEAGIEYVPYYRIADENFTCYPFLKKAE